MHGAIPPLPNTPSLGDARLKKAQVQLYIYILHLEISLPHTAEKEQRG